MSAEKKKLRKLMIVIEETGSDGGKGFNVYMAGDKERIGKIDYDQMSPAEFWGSKLFSIVVDVIRRAGAVKTIDGKEMH